MDKKNKKHRINPVISVPVASNSLKNKDSEWDIIESDVLGSYTGIGNFDEYPVQDADDL